MAMSQKKKMNENYEETYNEKFENLATLKKNDLKEI